MHGFPVQIVKTSLRYTVTESFLLLFKICNMVLPCFFAFLWYNRIKKRYVLSSAEEENLKKMIEAYND